MFILFFFFLVDEQLCLYLPELQKDLCLQSYYRQAMIMGSFIYIVMAQ